MLCAGLLFFLHGGPDRKKNLLLLIDELERDARLPYASDVSNMLIS